MLMKRVVVCLDVDRGRVRKGVRFENLRDIGDPVEMAERYEAEGADEIVFLDISASREDRATLLDVVRRTAERIFIPLTVGGGVRSADDIGLVLRAGADKVSINSAAVMNPGILDEASRRYGAQCVVASIDACHPERSEANGLPVASLRATPDWIVVTHGGRNPTSRHAVDWAVECEQRGAGEILLTSIDRDGSRRGYDIELTRAIASAVAIPVVASGGAGTSADIPDVLTRGRADAALVAGILHDGVTTVGEIKQAMVKSGLAIRSAA